MRFPKRESYLCVMALAFPADVAPQFQSWLVFLENAGGWHQWMRQLNKDLGPLMGSEQTLETASRLEDVYASVLTLMQDAMVNAPQALTSCLYQTDVPENWLAHQPLTAEWLAKAVMWRTLQKVIFRYQFTHPV